MWASRSLGSELHVASGWLSWFPSKLSSTGCLHSNTKSNSYHTVAALFGKPAAHAVSSTS